MNNQQQIHDLLQVIDKAREITNKMDILAINLSVFDNTFSIHMREAEFIKISCELGWVTEHIPNYCKKYDKEFAVINGIEILCLHEKPKSRDISTNCPDCGNQNIEIVEGALLHYEANHSGQCKDCGCIWIVD